MQEALGRPLLCLPKAVYREPGSPSGPPSFAAAAPLWSFAVQGGTQPGPRTAGVLWTCGGALGS